MTYIHASKKMLEERIGGCEEDVAEAILFCEYEEGIQEDLEGECIVYQRGEFVRFV